MQASQQDVGPKSKTREGGREEEFTLVAEARTSLASLGCSLSRARGSGWRQLARADRAPSRARRGRHFGSRPSRARAWFQVRHGVR
jgi:hypothetical protein